MTYADGAVDGLNLAYNLKLLSTGVICVYKKVLVL